MKKLTSAAFRIGFEPGHMHPDLEGFSNKPLVPYATSLCTANNCAIFYH